MDVTWSLIVNFPAQSFHVLVHQVRVVQRRLLPVLDVKAEGVLRRIHQRAAEVAEIRRGLGRFHRGNRVFAEVVEREARFKGAHPHAPLHAAAAVQTV